MNTDGYRSAKYFIIIIIYAVNQDSNMACSPHYHPAATAAAAVIQNEAPGWIQRGPASPLPPASGGPCSATHAVPQGEDVYPGTDALPCIPTRRFAWIHPLLSHPAWRASSPGRGSPSYQRSGACHLARGRRLQGGLASPKHGIMGFICLFIGCFGTNRYTKVAYN